MKKLLKVACIAGLLTTVGCTLLSCNDDKNPNPEVTDKISVTELRVTADVTNLKVGESVQLNVTVLPINATNKNVNYKTSSDAVTVSELGVVTASKAGEATVTITTEDGGLEKTISFVVVEASENGYLSLDKYTEKLIETPYTISDLSGQEKYGLGNPGNVGVHKELIKEKYPTKADSEFEAKNIIKVADITLEQVKTYFKDATELNNYYKIQTAINLAKEINATNKEAKIKLPGGTLNIDVPTNLVSKHVFVIDGLNGLYIEGNNTTISVKTNGIDWKGYFNITNSKNVHFNDVTLELAIPSSAAGVITAADVDKKEITLKIDKEFAPLMEIVKGMKVQPKMRSWVEFNHATNAPLLNGNFKVDQIHSYKIDGNANDGYTMVVKFITGITRPRNNSRAAFAFSQYDAVGIYGNKNENLYFENLTLHHASGMAVVIENTRNLYMNRYNLCLKEGSNSLMTATADALHFNLLHGDAHVTNSLIENSHDDALNIKHGYWYKLNKATGGTTRTLMVSRMTGEIETPKVGDKVAVYNEATFEGHNPTQGFYTIKEVKKTADGYELKVNERMSNVGEWGTCRVTFLSDTPNFNFSNNIVRNKRNRGVLVQVENGVIENNTFENVGHGSIQCASTMDIYNECTIPQGVRISNNKFIGNCKLKPEPLYADISIFAASNNATVAPAKTLHGYTIENNFVSDNGNAAVSLKGVGGDTIVKDNYFNECSSSQPSGEIYNAIFHMYNVDDVVLDGNYNNYTLDLGLSGIVTEGTTAEKNIEVKENNYGIAFKQNTEAGPEVNVSKATSTLTIDGDLSDWDSAKGTNIDILGYSTADGLEKQAADLQDFFKIKKLMMTHDDKGIYLGFDIKDDLLDFKTVNDFWLGDCVELFISTVTDKPNADMQVYKNEGGVLQAAFAPKWSSQNFTVVADVRSNDKYVENKGLIEAKLVTTTDGYAGEVCFPYTFAPEFKAAIDAGQAIDMAIVVADSERPDLGLMRVQAGNVPHFVESYKTKTARMPQYIFK